ncbi:S-type Pyocin [Pseudomonas mohnii]|uniref:S-type Pyocin n=1 Tax=Pseudomonas mohnii TaxID=395600 RepID=A0ABY0Y893_9PSED|nr:MULTISPECIES: S-type pyocin domain-containing protein [Pseudomonas]SED12510.1 S-type Pyocin [Pseudomonas mohnii]
MDKDTPEKTPFDDIWRRKRPNGGASWAAWNPPPEPERVYIAKDEWPLPKERTDLVFAKSCVSENWCSTQVGTSTVPASDFGKVMLAGAMLVPSAAEAASLALGFDAVLGRIAGGGILQQGFTWAIRGVTGPAGVFVLGMLPSKMADGTLYTDRQLRSMTRAPTRVRFQFRRDAEGVLQVYGIHTGPTGDDSVRTVQAKWNATRTAIEAELNGATILWTPRERSGIPAMVHPDASNSQGTLLVHPISQGTDSQIEGYPSGDDIETDDCILVFPADSGLSSLYLVFSRPARLNSGTVTGQGEDVTGIWLAGAGTALGSPIPTQIADKLRGREFSNFDKFREAFWVAVANTPELSEQFIPGNVERMRNGLSPKVRKLDRAGERTSFELHHVIHVASGGALYDVDNLRVNTPKNHIENHRVKQP